MSEKTWYENMMRQQHGGVTAHSPSFAAPSTSHVSASGHYGYQPPAQMDHQMTDKENTAMEFHHGMCPRPWPLDSGSAGGHGSGIGPAGGSLGVRKRGRDEVLFQEFKRRRLTEPEAMAMSVEPVAPPPAPVAPAPAPIGHAGWRTSGSAPRCLMRHMI